MIVMASRMRGLMQRQEPRNCWTDAGWTGWGQACRASLTGAEKAQRRPADVDGQNDALPTNVYKFTKSKQDLCPNQPRQTTIFTTLPSNQSCIISIDTIAGFSKYGHSKTYLHVIVNHLTRYAWSFPSKSTSTQTYIQTLKTVLKQEFPKRLLSDRAPAFTSEKFRKILITHGIQPLLTTSNNPQANGLIERLNATITGKLRLAYLENPKASWTQLVERVTQTYNNTPHSVTSFPLTYLMFNVIPPDLRTHLNPYPEITIAREIARSRTQNKHKKDKETFDKQHRTPHFEVNDLVLVKNYRHPDTGKLAPYFTGPYTIIEIISPNVLRIDRPNQPLNRDSDTIHVNKLKYYTENVLYITPPQPRFVQNPQRLPQHVYLSEFNHLTPDIFETQLFLIIPPTTSQPFLYINPGIFK
ncbi:hypothetical protein LAZ67_13000029 [Cordylochernes scorpioides]|uniref:Integrase catalytic domain-containing protein n=1 Tax=Cordylochernes scorpioides TaxID=51811 RepID=A0ABY6L2K6_9ARAC|nr:hypothetical protein LAZ67_13000029 [Cordylochernes scorpioides]